MKKVMVSGCYDLLHSGHVVFFETAAKYGELYVCLGSDKNIELLKIIKLNLMRMNDFTWCSRSSLFIKL